MLELAPLLKHNKRKVGVTENWDRKKSQPVTSFCTENSNYVLQYGTYFHELLNKKVNFENLQNAQVKVEWTENPWREWHFSK